MIKDIIKNIVSPTNLLIHLFFLVYALFAVLYYKERLYGDSSYFIFHLINEETFRIEHQRFVQFFFQLLPLAALKLGLPYKIILIVYSLGNVAYFYIITAICVFILKDRLAAFAVILLLMFGTSYLYFCPIFEIWYGLAVAILFYSLLHKKIHLSNRGLLIVLAVEALALFSHPLVFILISFCIILDIIENNKFNRAHIYFFAIILLWIISKPFLLSDYEGGKMDYIFDPDKNKSYLNLFSINYLVDLGKLFVGYYKLPIILTFITSVYFWLYGHRKQCILLLSSFVLYVIFINVTQVATHLSFYNERMYLLLIPLSSIPFVYFFFGRLIKGAQVFIIIIFCVLVYRQFQNIRIHAANYTERVEHTQRLINYTTQLEGSKFLIHEENYRKLYNDLEWSLPVEAMLYSSLEGADKSTTICTTDDMDFNDNGSKLTSNNFIFRRWDIIDDASLNPKYFSMQHGEYVDLNEYCCVDSIDEFFNSCIEIEVKTLPYYQKGKQSYVRVHIKNPNNTPICSNPDEGIYLSYHWYQGQYPVIWDGLRTPLEVNLINEHSQDISVQMPDREGEYQLVVDIIVEYRAWFGVDGRSSPVHIY